MSLEVHPSRKSLEGNPGATSLVAVLEAQDQVSSLEGTSIYLDFPIYRDADGELVTPQLLLLSSRHGVVIVGMTTTPRPIGTQLEDLATTVEQQLNHIYGRLLPSKILPKTRTTLNIPVNAMVYAPSLSVDKEPRSIGEIPVLVRPAEVADFLANVATDSPLKQEWMREIEALIDGTKGLRQPKKREIRDPKAATKGALAMTLEAEIATLDHKQKHGAIVAVRGAQRIRGIAGSGKTVILAMKAALAQVQYADARILYTFHTRSLYQHIRYLITRSYRNRSFHDVDWDRLNVLHSWGGKAAPGVYSDACERAGTRPLTFSEANQGATGEDALEYACAQLLNSGRVQPFYDFAFIDEGQDFAPAFLQLCAALTKDNRVVVAYDELQTIFQTSTPTAAQMFGTDKNGAPRLEFQEDIVLHKCYRNPRQILICAHAIGLGIYGPRIAQMPENEEHWEDLGYEVESGEMKAKSKVVIVRPEANSPNTISATEDISESIKCAVFEKIDAEVDYVAKSIETDISEGLLPEDVMVASLDNRYAAVYMSRVAAALGALGIRSHDVHAMRGGTGDFSVEGHVTLTTLNKAKGNEAYVVYLTGVDAVWGPKPMVRHRNMVFTGLTRAKGWVRVTGLGDNAKAFSAELAKAKAKYPRLEFTYPTEPDLRVMKRDLEAAAAHKVELLEELEKLVATKRAKTSRTKPKA
jgi:superfamily I DNA and RNA helicase